MLRDLPMVLVIRSSCIRMQDSNELEETIRRNHLQFGGSAITLAHAPLPDHDN